MIIDSGLAQQASAFANSMNVKDAPSVEKGTDEVAQDAKVPQQKQGDTVSISLEGRALAAAEESGESDSETATEKQIQSLKDQIEKLQEEIKEIQEDESLTEKQKMQQVQAKQVQLMELQKQLAEAQEEVMKDIGATSGGGTRAQGFGNSVGTF
jgi:predicted RNase H-like nuclease (RuvC/YqgF family)